MNRVFGKEPITSSQFPVVLFAARGLLVHSTPPLERFVVEFLKLQKVKPGWSVRDASCNEKAVQKEFISIRNDLNQTVQNSNSIEVDRKFWFEKILRSLLEQSPTNDQVEQMFVAYDGAVKWAIPHYVMEVCDKLKERGYQLAVASNATHDLAQLFRLQGLLGTFEVVLTADDLGVKKPHPDFFERACEDLTLKPEQMVYIGPSYALDVFAAQKAGLNSVLYDPNYWELRALSQDADTSGKVVALESLRNHRALRDVRVLVKFEELLEFCQ